MSARLAIELHLHAETHGEKGAFLLSRDGDVNEARWFPKSLCALVIDGVMLGALDHVDGMRPDGAPITGAAMPKQWLARLEKAVVVGAFERLTVSEIVTRILTTEAEGA